MGDVVVHCIAKQRQTIVEDWCGGYDFICLIVNHKAKISQMPVLVEDYGVEDKHINESFVELIVKLLLIVAN